MMIGPRPEAVAEAEGRIKTADALVAFSQAHLDYHTIRAPIDGVLDSLTCHPGQTIAIGSPIGEVVDTRQVFASVWLPTRSASSVARRAGRPGPARGCPRFCGRGIGRGGKRDGGQGRVRGPGRRPADRQPADPRPGGQPRRGGSRIGQSIRVSITVDERKGVLQVPAVAILDLGEGPVLNVVRDGKSVVLHPEVGDAARGLGGGLGHRPEGGRAGDRRGRLQPAGGDAGQGAGSQDGGASGGGGPPMSLTLEPETENRSRFAGGGINLVARARPYFGLIVLTTGSADRLRRRLDAPHAQRHLSRGRLPADRRHRPDARPGGQGRRGRRHPADRGGRRASSWASIRVRSKSVRGAAELSIDFAPGTDMIQALNDVRARMAEVGAQLPAGTTTITERQTPSVFPIISFVVTGGRDPSALHDYAYYDLRPRISRIPDVSYVTVQGGDIREILVEVDPQALVAANLSIADVADRLSKEHRLKAVGRLDRGALQYQVLADTLATDPLDLEDRVIAEKNGQSIRLRDLGRVTIGHEDRTMAIRSNGKDAVALTVFRRLGGNALAVSQRRWRPCWPTPPRVPRPASRSIRSTIRGCWSARRSPTSATPSSSAACMSVVILLVVPQEPAGHPDRRALDSAEPHHQLRLPLPDRRHAEPDVAGRPGRGHRPDHRRHRGRDREHRAAPGRGADRRRGRRPRQPGDQRRGHRLDPDDDPGLRARWRSSAGWSASSSSR